MHLLLIFLFCLSTILLLPTTAQPTFFPTYAHEIKPGHYAVRIEGFTRPYKQFNTTIANQTVLIEASVTGYFNKSVAMHLPNVQPYEILNEHILLHRPVDAKGYITVYDIDDTLKPCKSWNPLQAVIHHLFKQYEPLENMGSFVKGLHKKLTLNGIEPVVYYLGASPFVLGEALITFVTKHMIPGVMLLNTKGLNSHGAVSDFVSFGPAKSRYLGEISAQHPNRQLILFGDSAMEDADIYSLFFGTAGRGRVQCIMIRLIPVPEARHSTMTSLETLFANQKVGRENWFAYSDVLELDGIDFAGGKCRP